MCKSRLIIHILLLGTVSLNAFELPNELQVSAKCRLHFLEYVSQITTKLWALRMFDATTKLPDGLLYGNILQLGNFDECMKVGVINDTQSILDGEQTAFSLLAWKPNATSIEIDKEKIYSNLLLNFPQFFHLVNTFIQALPVYGENAAKLPYFYWGLCLPSACSATDVEELVATIVPIIFDQLLPNAEVEITTNVKKRNQYVKADLSVPLSADAWTYLSVHFLLVSIVIIASFLDWRYKEGKDWKVWPYLKSFSARANAKHVFSTRREPNALNCLHGLRVGSILWIILGHRYAFDFAGPMSNAVEIPQYLTYPRMMTLNATLGVDTFLFMSGLLMCYTFFKQCDRTKKFDLFKFYVYRYFRLTVPYVLLIFFYVTTLTYMGQGPMWNMVVDNQVDECKHYWWSNLLYINNYIGPPEFCVGQSWYLAVDMQLAWISPVILIPLLQFRRAGLQLMSLLILVSCFIPFTVTYINEYFWTLHPLKPNMEWEKDIYLATQSRATPYLIGILLGYILYKIRGQKIVMNKWTVACGWTFSTGCCLAIVYTLSIAFQTDYVYNPVDAAFYAGFHRLGWSLGLAWMVFACVHGYGGPVDAILSMSILKPFSRLTYSAYLVHFIVLIYDLGAIRISKYMSNFFIIHHFLGDLPFHFVFATYLYFISEGPTVMILRQAFDKASTQRNTIDRPTENKKSRAKVMRSPSENQNERIHAYGQNISKRVSVC